MIKTKVLPALVLAVAITGCVSTPGVMSKPHFSGSQKVEFEGVLSTDKYASMCRLGSRYSSYLKTRKDAQLINILVEYARNLENSCIDLDGFEAAQRSRESNGVKTYFAIDRKSVSRSRIVAALNSGAGIDSILAPYVPNNPQFHKLLSQWHATGNKNNKIRLNLERTKIMPDIDQSTYVLINVPEFKFRLFEDGSKSMEFAVVTGKPNWQTPIFHSTMKYIVLNPAWNVPDSIAKREIIPAIIKNPGYLKSHNMVVRRDYNIDSPAVDPSSVNWKLYLTPKYKNRALPYKIIEKASDANALGTVKFMFPNRFSVYMHDTQSKRLFSRSSRAFSHGCVRLSKPQELLEHVSNNYTSTPYSVAKEKAKTANIKLNHYIPVYIEYLTSYVTDGGMVVNRPDVYGYDSIQKLIGN